jgi:hypothetical protein
MYSQLFRRETSRRLRAVKVQVIDLYLESRFHWLDHYSRPSREGLMATMDMLAEAVERDDVTWYRAYCAEQMVELIQQGTAPIAVLAAGDLLYDVVLRFLTPDQRDLVAGIVYAERTQRQSIVYDSVMAGAQERGA